MTTVNEPPTRRRFRGILIIAGAVVLGLVVGLILASTGHHKDTAGQGVPQTAVPVPSSSAVSSASALATSSPNSVDDVSGTLADGCLGGSDPFSAVLAAQKAATPDNNGAAAFARTVARWAASYPSDPNAAAVLAKIQAPGSAFTAAGMAQTQKADAALQAQGYVSGGCCRTSANTGCWVASPVAGSRGAIIEIQIYRELTDTSGQTSQAALTTQLVLQLSAGVWTVVGSPPNPQDPPVSVIPWQSFDGAC